MLAECTRFANMRRIPVCVLKHWHAWSWSERVSLAGELWRPRLAISQGLFWPAWVFPAGRTCSGVPQSCSCTETGAHIHTWSSPAHRRSVPLASRTNKHTHTDGKSDLRMRWGWLDEVNWVGLTRLKVTGWGGLGESDWVGVTGWRWLGESNWVRVAGWEWLSEVDKISVTGREWQFQDVWAYIKRQRYLHAAAELQPERTGPDSSQSRHHTQSRPSRETQRYSVSPEETECRPWREIQRYSVGPEEKHTATMHASKTDTE